MSSSLVRGSRSLLNRFYRSKQFPSSSLIGTLQVRSVHLKKHEAENDVKGFTLVSSILFETIISLSTCSRMFFIELKTE
jgi:hypothetical protein